MELLHKTNITWIGDIKEGLKTFGKEVGHYFNDVTNNQRRIKFYQYKKLTIDEMTKLQNFIEKRRPGLNITVKDWTNANSTGPFAFSGPTYCVYYKPKVVA